jgi:hypothetical protein
MEFTLKHVQVTATGHRYRRRIPLLVKEVLGGKEWFLRPLGKSQAEAIRNYGKVHEEFERLVETGLVPF